MKHTRTKTFLGLLAPKDAEIELHSSKRDQLARTLQETEASNATARLKKHIKKTAGLKQKLESVRKKLAAAIQERHSILRLDIAPQFRLQVLIELLGCLWTSVEIEMWYKKLGRHEGPGEQALRARLGVPERGSSHEAGDIVMWSGGKRVIFQEVKSVDPTTSRDRHLDPLKSLQTIQSGAGGRQAYLRAIWKITDAEKARLTPSDDWHVSVGELGKELLESLPVDLKDMLMSACTPDRTLGEFQGTNACNRHGFLYIPREECIEAWRLNNVTKAGPKYLLDAEYLLKRIVKESREKIGLVAMSAKPYHAGHAGLIARAARECDEVHLYVSTSDRIKSGEHPVTGDDMYRLWKETIERSLPGNVRVVYGGSPVGNVWSELGKASTEGSFDDYVIYSDPQDLSKNFREEQLVRYCQQLHEAGHVKLCAVERSSTVNVSGTKMRQLLESGDRRTFVSFLPEGVDKDLFWHVLSGPSLKKTTKHKKPAPSRDVVLAT